MEDPLYSQLLRLKATGLFGQVDEETLRSITGELEECHVAGGDTVLRAGEPSDSVYVVLSGRLRAYVEREGKEHAVGEIGSGDSVGEMAVLTDEPRSATVRALRDSELVRLSRETFDQLLRRYPGAMMAVTRSIVERL